MYPKHQVGGEDEYHPGGLHGNSEEKPEPEPEPDSFKADGWTPDTGPTYDGEGNLIR